MSGPRFLLAGGGTGGHVFPLLAVAQALEALAPDASLHFVGTERGMEARAMPSAGYPISFLPVHPLKGGGAAGLAKGLTALPRAMWEADAALRRFGPDAVLSAGGYAAGPVTLAAAARGLPTALMEQNAVPGLTHRLLGRAVRRCFLSLPITGGLPPSKCVLVGNPVRRALLEAAVSLEARPAATTEGRLRVLVTGGSGGAGPLNAKLPACFLRLPTALAQRVELRHQAGRGRADKVRAAYQGFGGQVQVCEFIEDMAEAYAWADLTICRAGATTLAELLVLGRPALLIPFAGAADNHQEHNARAALDAGAAWMLREDQLDGGEVERRLQALLDDPAPLAEVSRAAKRLAKPDAAQEIARALLGMAQGTHP